MGKKRSKRKRLAMIGTKTTIPAPVPNEETLTNNIVTQEERQPTPLNILFPIIKACRLCENKEGPFLNIFGTTEKVLAKKIEDLLPFVIKEDDELPHKICYRCSAKVEELHDFVQKCIKSQENLEKEVGKKDSYVAKPNSIKKKWEEKLIKTDRTNDDICDAVIQKAIERIRDINPKYIENKPKDVKVNDAKKAKDDIKKSKDVNPKPVEIPVNNVDILNKVETSKKEKKLPKNATTEVNAAKFNEKEKELNVEQAKDDGVAFVRKTRSGRLDPTINYNEDQISAPTNEPPKAIIEDKVISVVNETKPKKRKQYENKTKQAAIKESNSVVITTEFKINSDETKKLKKPAFNIMDHVSTIKVNGVGTLFQCKLCNRNFLNKEAVTSHGCAKYGAPKDVAKPALEPVKVGQVLNVKYITQNPPENSDKKTAGSELTLLPKPRPGPASKKHLLNTEGKAFRQLNPEDLKKMSITNSIAQRVSILEKDSSGSLTIRKIVNDDEPPTKVIKFNPVNKKKGSNVLAANEGNTATVSITTPSASLTGPYPVGLFQTIPRNDTKPNISTPAMKKQSYTVLQTDNPSKLLISTRPRSEIVGPKSKKIQNQSQGESSVKNQQPFSVRLEDSDRQTNANDGFFTFINVDPLLQPSYVLPTDNIIQESQISTSTSKQAAKSKDTNYPCTMCKEVFSREKKLLAHIQAHFNAIDQEDRSKKRSRNA